MHQHLMGELSDNPEREDVVHRINYFCAAFNFPKMMLMMPKFERTETLFIDKTLPFIHLCDFSDPFYRNVWKGLNILKRELVLAFGIPVAHCVLLTQQSVSA